MKGRIFTHDLPSQERLAELYPNRPPLARNLIYLRGVRGWSQVMLADLAGVSGTAISTLEMGVTLGNMRTLQKLATALNVSVSKLVEGL
jgi:transcriptional regulator with XRE-family HTH domain